MSVGFRTDDSVATLSFAVGLIRSLLRLGLLWERLYAAIEPEIAG
jgi:hypothetical protein